MGIGRIVSRVRRGEFSKKNPFPKKLSFLKGIPLFAVTECIPREQIKRQARIEVFPASIKKIVSVYEKYEESRNKILNQDRYPLLDELRYSQFDITIGF